MSNPQPWVKFSKTDSDGGQFVMSPLKRGMGLTIGNSLRRVLLSSMSGSAVTAIKINGVEHEFSSIPHIQEDVMEIICNVKGIVFKSHSDEPKTLTLQFNGKGSVLAKEIKADSEVEIINPKHHIAELTGKGKLEMELTIEKGIGYSPSEAHKKDDQGINTILIDASFSPVVRVNHHVEHIRVGKELDYDSLVMDVWTNGSVSVEDVVKEASSIITSHFHLFGDLNKKPEEEKTEPEADPMEQKKASAMSMTVDDLELSARSLNCLKKAGIEKVAELIEKDMSELIQIKNFGKKSADEINDKLKQYGLALKDDSQEEAEDKVEE